jgi:erythromycin esterase-like protein
MAAELAARVASDERARCLAIWQRHFIWQYTTESPYGPKDKALILGCLEVVDGANEARVMVENMKRLFARAFRDDTQAGADTRVRDFNDRDRSMYLNFEWLREQLPADSKVIVWAATNHVAKDLSGASGLEGMVPFGSYVRKELGDRAFALGFSAVSGSYAMRGQPVRQLSAAPEDSLEARGPAESEKYMSLAELQKLGQINGRALGTTFRTARWDTVVDGMVVLREERAPEFVPW